VSENTFVMKIPLSCLGVSENGANGLSLEQSWDKQKLLRMLCGHRLAYLMK
jgi:hypothetical protein